MPDAAKQPTQAPSESQSAADDMEQARPTRKRPKPGERRVQILQALAAMLEQPGGERATTAALAGKMQVSEAALYRHFASKAQMFEGLLEFIEQSVFGLINQINERGSAPQLRAATMVSAILQFADKNPGMTRVMVGDALVHENARLQERVNGFFLRVEAALRAVLKEAADSAGSAAPTAEAGVRADALLNFMLGRMQRYTRSGFKDSPVLGADSAVSLIVR